MNILESIVGAQNGAAVEQLAAQFGLKPEQASAAVSALMPALAAGFQKNMSTEGGLASLLGALSSGKHQAYLEDPSKIADPSTVNDGNAILGHLFGSKEVSRQVAANASQQTGVDSAVLKKMLPVVAAMAMGAMARQTAKRGDARPGQADAGAAKSGLLSMLQPMLDRDRDGSLLNDVAGMMSGLLGGRK
jgi:hypothetical protein